jgi:uncharacterized protein (TIGR02996 family)
MNDNDAFLQAILENPDDDPLRLIYADWLEERGDPRGEFIRVQMALTAPNLDAMRSRDLLLREMELRAKHEAEWLGPLRQHLKGWTFRRGFLDEVDMDTRAFLEHAPALFHAAPVRCLRARNTGRLVRKLANCPLLARLRQLSFAGGLGSGCALGEHGLEVLARSPHLHSLRVLVLPEYTVDLEGVRALAAAPALAGLVHLRLSDNSFGDLGLQAILASPHFGNLRHLYVEGCGISNTGMDSLARSGLISQLETLALRHNDNIDNLGVRSLTRCRRLGSLRRLWLGGLPINGVAIDALAQSKQLTSLVELDLSHTHVGDSGAEALTTSPHLQNLTSLNLYKARGISEPNKQRLRERFGNRVVL